MNEEAIVEDNLTGICDNRNWTEFRTFWHIRLNAQLLFDPLEVSEIVKALREAPFVASGNNQQSSIIFTNILQGNPCCYHLRSVRASPSGIVLMPIHGIQNRLTLRGFKEIFIFP